MDDMKIQPFFSVVSGFLRDAGIECFGIIPFDECKVILPHKIMNCGFEPRSAVVFVVPYFSREAAGDTMCKRTLSLYAVPRDYHVFFKNLFEEMSETLSTQFPEVKFRGYSDDSAIDEVNAASKAGIGIIGSNGLLINRRYGSFIFIGEILTSLEAPESGCEYNVELCENCGRCRSACPCECIEDGVPSAKSEKQRRCLSSLTQSKTEPDDGITNLMRGEGEASATIWGCDECQLACPYNENPEETPIGWFRSELITELTPEAVSAMSDEEFAQRAFAWRGRKVIERNVRIVASGDLSPGSDSSNI